jgi:hypothetical protein
MSDVELKECPFCGSPPDHKGDNFYGCMNANCPASVVCTSPKTWNTRTASASMGAWQPIESAPRDMSKILLYVPTMLKTPVVQGCVNASGTIWREFEDNADYHGSWTTSEATHWQPLPAPPTALEGEE